MNPKYIFAGILALGFIVGWNAFLIQRDQKLFDAYDQKVNYVQPPTQDV